MRIAKRVLAVDDNPVNLEILNEILGEDYTLKIATSGPEAIAIARKFKPRVVLLDVMMPKMDGLETCRQLRGIQALQDTRIAMVSAKAMPSEQAAGIRAGADDYITKPFDEVEVLALLRQYFEAEAENPPATQFDEPSDDGLVLDLNRSPEH
jgi:CheY-like chemotaxis protein